MDELDDIAQPRCPECGTVLRDIVAGFECATCGLVFVGSADFNAEP